MHYRGFNSRKDEVGRQISKLKDKEIDLTQSNRGRQIPYDFTYMWNQTKQRNRLNKTNS